jgi:hypothetical protein
MFNFYQKRPVFALKIHPRPQRPMKASKGQQRPAKAIKGQQRPAKASKGQQRPAKSKTSKIFDIINIQCIIINKCKFNPKKKYRISLINVLP